MTNTAIVLQPPAPILIPPGIFSLFLAGSIEMDRAEKWQTAVITALSDLPIIILNPRREDFNPEARQTMDDPYFREQVEWELTGLEQVQRIWLYFAPGTQSPISLLEYGLFAWSGRVQLCCPAGFWRKGNVDIVAVRYGIPQFETLTAMIAALRSELLPAKD